MQNDLIVDGINISTYFTPKMKEPYMAVNMNAALSELADCDLTLAEKSDLPTLLAGHAYTLDNPKFIAYGKTELEAISNLLTPSTEEPR